ncbi:MAG: NADH-quinone oxidoreductase subunit J [Cyclobacteriaceae bacterium]
MDGLTNIDLNVVAFYMLAGMSVSSALMIVFSKNLIRSIFLLVVVFMGVAGIYIISNAEFVAITQILVYVGGVVILLMFGIMLTNRLEGQQLESGHKRVIPAILVGGGILYTLLCIILSDNSFFNAQPQESGITTTQKIGINLMTDQVLALEITAVLLLVALVGAAFLVGIKTKEDRA